MSRNHTKEVIPGLILGGILDLSEMLQLKPDVLVPLDYLPGIVWNLGFRGEILYYPISDYDVLPVDVLDELVESIVKRLGDRPGDGKRLAIFCNGGHGRTGYVASCVLSRFGYEDPVCFIRQNYNRNAVETKLQMEEIQRYMERHKEQIRRYMERHKD